MKKCLILCTVILLVLSGISMVILFNSDYYYAKRLVKAIEAEDIVAIEQILEEKPSCVNSYPQILPERMFYRMGEVYGPTYPMIAACESDNVEIVRLLLEAGADTNCNDGRTPLNRTYRPKRDNWYQISLLLIEYGAALDYLQEYSGEPCVLIDIVQSTGYTHSGYIPESEEEVQAAFYYAIEHCDHSQVDWMWVLRESVSNNRVEIVQFLLDEGYCDVNDTSWDMSALMFAARDSTPKMVQFLLDRGADKTYVDSDGMTAYDYAAEEKAYYDSQKDTEFYIVRRKQTAEILEILED